MMKYKESDGKFLTIGVAIAIITMLLTIISIALVIDTKNKINDIRNNVIITPIPDYTEDDKDEPEEEPKTLYVDESGNTYEVIKFYTSDDGRELVLFQNIKTKTVSLAVKSYFDKHYHIVEE